MPLLGTGTSIGTLQGELVLVDKFSTGLVYAGQQLDEFGKKVDDTGFRIDRLSTVLVSMGSHMARVGDRMTLLTAPLTLAAAASVKFAVEFQESMLKVVTLAGTSVAELNKLHDAVLNIAKDTGRAPKELAEGLYAISSVGIRGAEALDVLKESAKAAALGMGETDDVARAVVAAMNAYGKEGLSASRAMDILHTAVVEGGAEADKFADTLGRVIAPAKLAGVSFEEVAASVATFTRCGGR